MALTDAIRNMKRRIIRRPDIAFDGLVENQIFPCSALLKTATISTFESASERKHSRNWLIFIYRKSIIVFCQAN